MVTGSDYRSLAVKVREMAQGYLCREPDSTVRVRVADGVGYLTVKTRNVGAVRSEWEYEIPLKDAREMLAEACGTIVEKTRYVVPATDGLLWEIDEFHGRHEGLVVAEIELPAEDSPFSLPDFIGKEVTGDERYYNSNL